MNLTQEYWSNRYEENKTGWDLSQANTFLVEQIKQYPKESKILIPGAGNAHEAEALFHLGYKQIYVLDWAEEPLANLKKRVPEFPEEQLIQGDFFEHEGEYDLILEQTFFCALDPSLREKYVEQMHKLLKKDGVLLGVWFNKEMPDGPPFGGSIAEYESLFQDSFKIEVLEECKGSVKPRLGAECFGVFRKL